MARHRNCDIMLCETAPHREANASLLGLLVFAPAFAKIGKAIPAFATACHFANAA